MTEFDLFSNNQKSWFIECESCFPDSNHFAAVDCVEGLPDELHVLELQANEDEEFVSKFVEWDEFICEKHLFVLLEQSCVDSVLLPFDLIYERVKECPITWLSPYETLLRECPAHVLAFLAQRYYLTVRMDRFDRTGKPDWNPPDGPFVDIDLQESSWKKASFVVRKYSG